MMNTSEGTNSWVGSSPVTVSPVLSRSQVILTSPVVGLLIKHPVSILYLTGMNFVVPESLINMRTIFIELHHLTTEIFLFINPDSE
ncbi:hypothetical protein GDO81_019070 [Engystomops pustulosus]|uniref:Uncharacterized protein n=1 Tax=Engystomops pustulosus TaxID=76066 RepID=A0AAV6ZNS7_ENGPU|nr:hypothetical protein GDO81_019070 [Engystomops pustulosus]